MDDFLLISNYLITFEVLKEKLSQKYSIKNIQRISIIIEWQILLNLISQTLKINQLALI